MTVALGDFISQTLIEGKRVGEVDIKRLRRAGFLGVTTIGVSMYFWYHKAFPLIFSKIPVGSFLANKPVLTLTILD